MATLTSLLARDSIVPLDVIEQALQRQVLEGGEIDTAVLELSSVPENVLASYRAASYGLPPALRDDIEHADDALAAALPTELARAHRVVPISRDTKQLVLAAPWPLRAAVLTEIARHTGLDPVVRIGTELRTEAALARCYGEELPRRFVRLRARLDSADPGAAVEVKPPEQPSEPPERRPQRTERELGDDDEHLDAPARDRAESKASAPESLPPPVRVVPVVRLSDSVRPAPTRLVDGREPTSDDTRPARPSKLPPRGMGRISGAPRGPLTQAQAMDMLGRAQDRDRVLDAFFSFARQYFACTVLFALRDDRMLGLESSGLPELDARALDLAVPRAGSVKAAVLERAGRVLDLTATTADRALATALSRQHAQPCAMIPITIRQRIVALLYGDRGGEAMYLDELAPLLQTLPAVSGAFERIIQQHKAQALKAREQAERKSPPPTPARSVRPTERKQTSIGAVPSRPKTETRMAATPAPSRSASVAAGSPSVLVPKAPRVPAELASLSEEREHVEQQPTVQLPAVEAPPRASGAGPRASQRPPGGYSLQGGKSGVRPHDQDTTQPARPSNKPPPPQGDDASAPDPPPPRTLSQAPPGAGAYSVSPSAVERAGVSRQPPPAPPPAHRAEPAAVSPARTAQDADSFGSRDPRRQTVPRRKSARTDPRREDAGAEGAGATSTSTEVVSISQAVRESIRPPARAEPEPAATPSIVVDFRAEALRMTDELIRMGPDEDGRVLGQLLRLGDEALPVLAGRFPGPMWFDRHRPRKRLPQGREISAIARALHAFEDKAVPYLAELLEAKQADTRFAATLLCADLVRPSLLWPLYQRLFDADGQVRLIALETLPVYRHVEGFDEVLKSLRERALSEREDAAHRLSAIEALGTLRDPGSVEVLAKLADHGSRQLSVPARRHLVAITGHELESERKWRAWLDKNRGRHRIEWLIDGLMHPEERVRSTAGLELQKTTQVYYGFVPTAGKREREQAQTRYRNWWLIEGKRLHGA